MAEPSAETTPAHVAIFFSDIVGFSELTDRLGDKAASTLINRINALQAEIIERDGKGRVIKFLGDSVFAIFDAPSVGMSRALEIQRSLHEWRKNAPGEFVPGLRMGLHMGEVMLVTGQRVDIVSRHVNRARRVMEAAEGGQILVSRSVFEAGRDFIGGVPKEKLECRIHGEYYLKGVGPTEICEITDRTIRAPAPPGGIKALGSEQAVAALLEENGYSSAERIGEGSFGVVYRARQKATGEEVAIKVLAPSICADPKFRERFMGEAERLRSLSSRSIAGFLDAKLDGKTPFIVMPFAKGRPLGRFLEESDFPEIAKVLHKICLAVREAHRKGIVHCDLKPGNIIVNDANEPLILDFGISVLAPEATVAESSSSTMIGTPAYMAPEQARGGIRAPQTDIYALGVVLYELLTRRVPFEGPTVHDVIQMHLHDVPLLPSMVDPKVPDNLQRICLKAMEKNLGDRYADIGEMIVDLETHLDGRPVRTRPLLYDNLLIHRAEQHLDQIRTWTVQGLLSREESHRLSAAYASLTSRGLPAIMEGRHFRFWQTLVYISGWAFLNGATIWLSLHWTSLERAFRLALGSVPAVSTLLLAALMHRLQRYRLTFTALIVTILAVPLMTGVWFYEFEIGSSTVDASYEFFSDAGPPLTEAGGALTNNQILSMFLVTLLSAILAMLATGTKTHSAQTTIALFFTYAAMMAWSGMKPFVMEGRWAYVGMRLFPLIGMTATVGFLLARNRARELQAAPWLWFTAVLLIGNSQILPLYGPAEWLPDAPHSGAVKNLFWSFSSLVLTLLGLTARKHLRHHGLMPTFLMILVGLITMIGSLSLAGSEWPEEWHKASFLGKDIPPPYLLQPLVCLGVALSIAGTQLIIFLVVGLAGLAFSLYFLGNSYFSDTQVWPALIMTISIAVFAATLILELKLTRGSAADDVVTTRL